jgi:hypothetical protein
MLGIKIAVLLGLSMMLAVVAEAPSSAATADDTPSACIIAGSALGITIPLHTVETGASLGFVAVIDGELIAGSQP